MVFLFEKASPYERISYLCIPEKINKRNYKQLIFKTIHHYVELVRVQNHIHILISCITIIYYIFLLPKSAPFNIFPIFAVH